MDRMQVYLEAEQRLRLNALARARGRPTAELIREAVGRYLDEEAKEISEDDGLFKLIGAGSGFETATDVASNHHRYLAMADSAHPKYEPAGQSRREKARSAPRKRRR